MTDVDKLVTPCGGCGETDPQNRCLGCFHDFGCSEVERYRDALLRIRDMNPTCTTVMTDGLWRDAHRDLQRIARTALTQTRGEQS